MALMVAYISCIFTYCMFMHNSIPDFFTLSFVSTLESEQNGHTGVPVNHTLVLCVFL